MRKRVKKRAQPYGAYVGASITYSFFGILGVVGAVYSYLMSKYLLLLVSLLIVFISSDVFFHGAKTEERALRTKLQPQKTGRR